MAIELIICDLDGTLLDSSGTISKATIDTIRQARAERGVQFVLASARPPRTMLPYYRQLELDSPLIAYNGALVFDPHSRRILLHRPLEQAVVRQLVDVVRRVAPDAVISEEHLDRSYSEHLVDAFKAATSGGGRRHARLGSDITKLLLKCQPDDLRGLVQAIFRALPVEVSIVQLGNDLLQVFHGTATKRSGGQVVAAELAIDRSAVMAIGDNLNDIELLEWAGLGLAVANAPDPVLAIADAVADDNDHEGVAKAIQKFVIKARPPRPPKRFP